MAATIGRHAPAIVGTGTNRTRRATGARTHRSARRILLGALQAAFDRSDHPEVPSTIARTRQRVAATVFTATALATTVLGSTLAPAIADAAPSANPPLEVVRSGDAVIGYLDGAPPASEVSSAASEAGFETFGGVTSTRSSFTVRLLTSSGVEGIRDEVARTFEDAADHAGLSATVQDGTITGSLDFTNPGTGFIEVVVASTSPCGALANPGVVGCGGPIISGSGQVVAGKVWITADYAELSQAALDVLVHHELGHALGLSHLSATFEGRRQIMYPSVSVDATMPGFRTGDRNGLAALVGPPVLTTTTTTTTPPTTAPSTTTTAPPTTTTAPPTTTTAPPAPSPAFVPVAPARILDTRSGVGSVAAPLGAGERRTLQVTGRGGVPSSGVAAVVLNLTAVGATAPTYLTAFPAGASVPVASNLNPGVGETAANLAIVPLGTGGRIELYNRAGGVHVLADVSGWVPVGGGDLVAATPSRVLDTRSGVGSAPARLGPDASVVLSVLGRGGVPVSGVAAVVLNVTAVAPTQSTFVTAFPTGTPRPVASNLNPAPGRVSANLVVVPLGTGGQVSLYNRSGTIDFVADVVGWLRSPAGGAMPVTPSRLLDTRIGLGAPIAALLGGGTVTVQVTGRGGVPATGVTAVVLNVTAVGASVSTFVTAFAQGSSLPLASNLNPVPGVTAANLVVVPVSGTGRVELYNRSGTLDLVVDVAGYFTG